ncbi:MAG: DUF2213 domain-containing protein [Scytonema sp. CRU_2_7]|nr:DUF2213 domain-containing protein [Scytonema sp. CRU_2_7]
MITIRHDKGVIKQKHLTAEGFLKVDAIFTRTGVFEYRNDDGTIRKELRHPDDVLKSDSLASMEMLPITFNHPKERVVDVENARKLQIGFTGQKINIDGENIKGTVVITDKDSINAIENEGIQELSLGYNVVLIKEDGDFKGQRFDYRQTEIKYNHLALVPKGRAGVSKLILDSVDAVQTETENKQDSNQQKEHNMTMVKKNLDGILYEGAPEIVNALDKATARADKAESDVSTLTKEVETLKANLDATKVKLDTAEKLIIPRRYKKQLNQD